MFLKVSIGCISNPEFPACTHWANKIVCVARHIILQILKYPQIKTYLCTRANKSQRKRLHNTPYFIRYDSQ